MNICIDVGNSTIGIGVFKENKLIERKIADTNLDYTVEDFREIFKKPFAVALEDEEPVNIIYSSVVPQINGNLLMAIKKFTDV